MPNVNVYDMSGKVVGDIALSDAVFGIEPNSVVMHAAVVNYLANQRQGTQSTLTRTEVRGGGRKPWRQKGTGHARQGSIRAPQWRHGGVPTASGLWAVCPIFTQNCPCFGQILVSVNPAIVQKLQLRDGTQSRSCHAASVGD